MGAKRSETRPSHGGTEWERRGPYPLWHGRLARGRTSETPVPHLKRMVRLRSFPGSLRAPPKGYAQNAQEPRRRAGVNLPAVLARMTLHIAAQIVEVGCASLHLPYLLDGKAKEED